MVGFAVMSYKENGVGGLVSQGLDVYKRQDTPQAAAPRRTVIYKEDLE